MKITKNTFQFISAPIYILFALSFFYYTPRFLVFQLGLDSPWLSFFYTYTLGSFVFFNFLFFIKKAGGLELKRFYDRSTFLLSIITFLSVLFLHAILIYLGKLPFKPQL